KGGSSGSQLGITHEGTVIGTADYIAPEQARDSRLADIRSDIYALGCAFYFALTGQVPFPGGAPVDKMLRHQIDEPPPLDRFRPHVPMLLATIIKRMMAKNPADRYQTPAEVAAALGPLVAGDNGPPPLAIPVGQAEQQTLADLATREDRRVVARPHKPADRYLSLWAVAFLSALAAVVFFSLAMVFAILMRALMN
ncbi:MAG TPA: hypothetical protein VE988_26225, partial [Gemmataceae bacterium]|nr:hypothetical protein [Gemmataceae bacterium]